MAHDEKFLEALVDVRWRLKTENVDAPPLRARDAVFVRPELASNEILDVYLRRAEHSTKH